MENLGCPARLTNILNDIIEGVRLHGYTLRGSIVKVLPGKRILLDIYLEGRQVAAMLVFCGQPPYYRPWIEVFGIEPKPGLECCAETQCSALEDALIELPARGLGGGEPLYFDYTWDEETMEILSRRVPPAATRIGVKMLRWGFTWLRHWYYPEGFMEGGEKIQGEKPLSGSDMHRHLSMMSRELEEFIESWRGSTGIMGKAVSYALEALRLVEALKHDKRVLDKL